MVTSSIQCPLCKTAQTIEAEKVLTIADLELFHCELPECGIRIAFGKMLDRIVVEPFTDKNGRTWVRQRFQNPRNMTDLYVIDIDPQWAAKQALNLLSLVIK